MTSISVRWMNLDTPMKHQMKHHQVFIWDETCFSSEIKHLHFNEINFLLFHLRRHVKNSGFVLYHGFQIPRNRWKHSACGLVLSSVSQYLEPVIKHSPSFLTYYFFIFWQWLNPVLVTKGLNLVCIPPNMDTLFDIMPSVSYLAKEWDMKHVSAMNENDRPCSHHFQLSGW